MLRAHMNPELVERTKRGTIVPSDTLVIVGDTLHVHPETHERLMASIHYRMAVMPPTGGVF